MAKEKRRINDFIDGICPLCHQVWDGFEYEKGKKEEIGEIKKRNLKKMVGERVKAYRLEKQITQEKFAKLLGKDRSNIGHIENGRISVSLNYLYKIKDVLGKSIHDFLVD